MGLNLHNIARVAINAVAQDLPCELYRSTGEQERGERGESIPVFEGPIACKGQWQSLSGDAIVHMDDVTVATITRRVYLYAEQNPATRPWALWRPLGRAGDYIKDGYGALWLIDSVLEDWTHEGWICVQATLQTAPVRMCIRENKEDDTDSDDGQSGNDGDIGSDGEQGEDEEETESGGEQSGDEENTDSDGEQTGNP